MNKKERILQGMSSEELMEEYESIGYNPVDVSPTLDARCKDGPIRNQQAPFVACFQQNSRHELRLIDGDGQLAGALTAEPGMTEQNYLAFSYKDYGDDAGVISPTLRSGGFKASHANSGAPPAICYHLTFCDANGRRKDRVNGGLYVNETDKSNALTAGDPGYATVSCLKDTSNLFVEKQDGVGQDGLAFTLDTRGRAGCLTPWDYQRMRVHSDKGLAPCLFNNGDGGGNEVPSVFSSNILRRFSPTECLRLQGFPDGYLDITYRGKPAFNGPKYRAIGNSWAVTVARWVGDRVDYVLDTITQLNQTTVFVDAVGSGPCFGPVVACAVVLKPGMEEQLKAQGITDSKAIIKSTTPQTKREQIWQAILPAVEHYAIAYATADEINTLGMGKANRLAMKRAVDKICKRAQVGSIIVDGEDAIAGYETISTPVVKADQKYPGVSAASCLAKIFRDSLVTRLWGKLPYGLSQYKGYSTEQHKTALTEHGLHSQHHINNGFVKQHGIRQPNNAAGQESITLYIGGQTNKTQGEIQDLGGYRCFTAAYRDYPQAHDAIGIIDSGAFSDSPEARLTFDQALARQLNWEKTASTRLNNGFYEFPVVSHTTPFQVSVKCQLLNLFEWKCHAIASYDLLIDEIWLDGAKVKQRWNEKDANDAVATTVEAARYLVNRRDDLYPRKLILGCQGVTADQYRECVEQILEFASPEDWIGLGGWCILGRFRSWIPTYWETLHQVIPLIADAGVKHVHLYGSLLEESCAALLWFCDQYGLTCSADSKRPILDVTYPNQVKAGVRAATGYWRDNVKWWQNHFATMRQSKWYREPSRQYQQLSILYPD